jgi:outer membrane protein
MRRFLTLSVSSALLLATPAFADLKVGYVDLQRALTEVHEGIAAKAKLKSDLDKKKNDFEVEQNKLRGDKDMLDKQGPMMSEEVRNQKFAELQKRLFELTQKAEKLQVEMAQAEQMELKKIFDKMDPIISGFAQRDSLTLMFDKSNAGLVYAPPSLDYTNELVRTYNEKYPKGGAGGVKKEGPAPKTEAPKKDGTPAAAK